MTLLATFDHLWESKWNPIRNYQTVSLARLYPFGSKGIDTLPTPLHNKRSSRCLPPADHGDSSVGFLQPTSLETRLSTQPLFSVGDFVGSLPYAVCHTAKWLKSSLERLSDKSLERVMNSIRNGSGMR